MKTDKNINLGIKKKSKKSFPIKYHLMMQDVTLLDYFAANAMKSFNLSPDSQDTYATIAVKAYRIASCMLIHRKIALEENFEVDNHGYA